MPAFRPVQGKIRSTALSFRPVEFRLLVLLVLFVLSEFFESELRVAGKDELLCSSRKRKRDSVQSLKCCFLDETNCICAETQWSHQADCRSDLDLDSVLDTQRPDPPASTLTCPHALRGLRSGSSVGLERRRALILKAPGGSRASLWGSLTVMD